METKKEYSGRETARICPLSAILSGEYILQEGWKPNYIQTLFGNISRINVIGVIVFIESSFRFLVDDGTSTMKVNDFSSLIEKNDLNVGDLVLIIARIREYENELCLVSESINKEQISHKPDWFKYRKEYLDWMLQHIPKDIEDVPKVEQKETPDVIKFETPTMDDANHVNDSDAILNFIRNHSSSTGCPTEEIIKNFDKPDIEDIINSLIAMGEVYEIKAGYLKVLE